MHALKVVLFVGTCWIMVQSALDACSWMNPIWPKDKHSDTPLFRFVVDGKGGYINASGKIVIPAKIPDVDFTNAGYDDFFEGVANVCSYCEKFINSTGDPVKISAHKLLGYGSFSEGLILVTMSATGGVRKTGFVDHKGNLVIGLNFDGAGNFAEGLAAVSEKGKWGYIDHAGKVVIPLRLNLAEAFSEGAARVIFEGPCNYVGYGHCAAANPSILGFPDYKSGWNARYQPCEYAFIDRRGAPLSSQRFKDAFDFSEGMAAVGNGKRWGFIAKSGAFQIPLQFEAVGSFSEGLAKFRQNGKWGYIDRAGRVAIAPQFEGAEDFSAGAAVVGSPFKEVWFIDKSGSRLFGRAFRAASTFRLGLAHVSDDGRSLGYIDRTGARVFNYRVSSQ